MDASPETLLQIRNGLMYLVTLILSISVHEFGHAFVADRLGDPLPRSEGRVTLNPLAHIDPIGTIAMPLMAFFLSLSSPAIGSRILGWGRPVRISLSARSMTRRLSRRTAHLLIALAGPMMNILFGLVLSAVVVVLLRTGGAVDHMLAAGNARELTTLVFNMVAMNIGLAIFNLIPCPPLDGGAVLRGLLPRSLGFITDALDRHGYLVLLVLLMSGALSWIMYPARLAAVYWADLLLRLAA